MIATDFRRRQLLRLVVAALHRAVQSGKRLRIAQRQCSESS